MKEGRLLKVYDLEFEPQEWNGEDTSGIDTIVGDRVLVLTDKVAEKTAGGIILTDSMRDQLNQSGISGRVAKVGDDAFTWNSDRTRPFNGRKPQVGDRVYFEKFAGLFVPGDDDKLYRVMDDRSIGAILSG